MKKDLLYGFNRFAGILFFLGGGCTDSFVPNSEMISFLVENKTAYDFLREPAYDNEDYSYSWISCYSNQETTYRKDCPEILTVAWKNESTVNCKARKINVYDTKDDCFHSHVISKGATKYELTNLIPNRIYRVEVIDYYLDGSNKTIFVQDVNAVGQLRMLNVEGYKTTNFRDLGGWKTSNNGTVRYGKLIRGGEVLYYNDGYDTSISADGIQTLVQQIGVQVEIDFGDLSASSPLEANGVEFIHGSTYQIKPYLSGLDSDYGRIQYSNCIRKIIEKLNEDKTVYYHCTIGADRTGTLSVIIEGLLGVSESDISKEYELTSFSMMHSSNRTRSDEQFCSMISYIKNAFPASNLGQSIYSMVTTPIENGGLGLSFNDIDRLRSIMIEY